MLVGDILRAGARNRSRQVAIIEGDHGTTYGDLDRRSNRLANALLGLGLSQGERVVLLLPNRTAFVEAFFATLKAGLVVVPLNILLAPAEIAVQVRQSGARACIYDRETAALAEAVRSPPDGTPLRFVGIEPASRSDTDYEAIIAAALEYEPPVTRAPDDLAMIMYTSGTTSGAKGVMSTHRNIVSNTNTMSLEVRVMPEDVTLIVMPMFHNGGLWPLLTHLYRGGKAVLHRRFREAEALAALERHRVSVLNLVPTTMARLIADPAFATTDLSALRLVMHGGGPIVLDALKAAMRALGPQKLFTSLGSTESNGMITAFSTTEHALEGHLATKLGSVGREAVGVEVRILDHEGREQPPGKVGELVVRGDNISPGYWMNPDETADVFRDGWLHGGDLAYRDEDGFIFIAGRKKDVIISGGENISSVEVEQVLERHPSVRAAAVFGVPDERWGEAVLAIVELNPDKPAPADEAALIAFCGEHLAAFKRPKQIRFVGEIPRTALGKIAKGELRKLLLETPRS